VDTCTGKYVSLQCLSQRVHTSSEHMQGACLRLQFHIQSLLFLEHAGWLLHWQTVSFGCLGRRRTHALRTLPCRSAQNPSQMTAATTPLLSSLPRLTGDHGCLSLLAPQCEMGRSMLAVPFPRGRKGLGPQPFSITLSSGLSAPDTLSCT